MNLDHKKLSVYNLVSDETWLIVTSAGVFGFNNKNYTVDDPEDILSAVYDKTTSSCKLITTTSTTSIEENDFIEIEVGRHKSGPSLDPTNSLVPGGHFVRKSPRSCQPFSYLFFYTMV